MVIKAMDLLSRLTAATIVLTCSQFNASEPTTYVSARFHYALQVPTHWRISVSGSLAVLFNFKPSQAGPQGLFPDPGAEIYVIPLAAVQPIVNAKTIDNWISYDLTSHHSAVSTKRLSGIGNRENAPQDVVEVEADFERDPQDEELQHETSYYFTLRGALFHLKLLHWRDDPRSASYRAACRSVLDSMRATSQ